MDIQASKPPVSNIHLPKVGINEFKIPVKYKQKSGGTIKLETTTSMYVSLNAETKGINMSRLPRTLYEHIDADEDVSLDLMEKILKDFKTKLESKDSYLKLKLNYPVRKASLITKASGWMYYPVEIEATLLEDQTEPTFSLLVSIFYSSTCPCSKGLSEKLEAGIVIRNSDDIKIECLPDEDKQRYTQDGEVCCQTGTPHAQRSRADIKIRFNKENPVWIEDIVEATEAAIKTPVQIIVKREDEQEFARLNAQNQMFVEDAVRLLSEAVDKIPGVTDWSVVSLHFESLHPSNAVCVNWKGVPGGLR